MKIANKALIPMLAFFGFYLSLSIHESIAQDFCFCLRNSQTDNMLENCRWKPNAEDPMRFPECQKAIGSRMRTIPLSNWPSEAWEVLEAQDCESCQDRSQSESSSMEIGPDMSIEAIQPKLNEIDPALAEKLEIPSVFRDALSTITQAQPGLIERLELAPGSDQATFIEELEQDPVLAEQIVEAQSATRAQTRSFNRSIFIDKNGDLVRVVLEELRAEKTGFRIKENQLSSIRIVDISSTGDLTKPFQLQPRDITTITVPQHEKMPELIDLNTEIKSKITTIICDLHHFDPIILQKNDGNLFEVYCDDMLPRTEVNTSDHCNPAKMDKLQALSKAVRSSRNDLAQALQLAVDIGQTLPRRDDTKLAADVCRMAEPLVLLSHLNTGLWRDDPTAACFPEEERDKETSYASDIRDHPVQLYRGIEAISKSSIAFITPTTSNQQACQALHLGAGYLLTAAHCLVADEDAPYDLFLTNKHDALVKGPSVTFERISDRGAVENTFLDYAIVRPVDADSDFWDELANIPLPEAPVLVEETSAMTAAKHLLVVAIGGFREGGRLKSIVYDAGELLFGHKIGAFHFKEKLVQVCEEAYQYGASTSEGALYGLFRDFLRSFQPDGTAFEYRRSCPTAADYCSAGESSPTFAAAIDTPGGSSGAAVYSKPTIRSFEESDSLKLVGIVNRGESGIGLSAGWRRHEMFLPLSEIVNDLKRQNDVWSRLVEAGAIQGQ